MAGPVDKVKVGMVEVAKWAGTYKEQATTSYSLTKQKLNKDTGKYEDTKFLGVTDLKDIMVACQMMLLKHYTPTVGVTDVKKEETPF